MDLLLTRAVVIGFAIAGALFALAASILQQRGVVSEARATQINYAGYVLMGISMLLFVTIGLRGGAA